MSVLVTDAIVLRATDYLESSRIMRLLTRDGGVLPVLARGARSSRKRFGNAVDLFAEGEAHIQVKPGRDLHTLMSFDVKTARPHLASDLARFTAAAALSEVLLQVVHDEASSPVFDVVSVTLSQLAHAPNSGELVLASLWQLLAITGHAPAIGNCALCHRSIVHEVDAAFHPASGGVLCDRCALLARGGRRLPASARLALLGWLEGETTGLLELPVLKAHQRLFREFLQHHVPDSRSLPAYQVWEEGGWA